MFESHLESIMFFIDDGIQINMSIEKFGATFTTNPTGDIAFTDLVTVMTVHEIGIHARIGAVRSEWSVLPLR